MFKAVSKLGIVSAIAIFALPFVRVKELFYPTENTQYFVVVGLVSVLGIYAVYKVFAQGKKFSTKNRWLLGSLLVSFVVMLAASFLGSFWERSLFSDILRGSGLLYLVLLFVGAYTLGEFFSKDDWKLVKRSFIASTGALSIFTILGPTGFRFLDTNTLILGNGTFAGLYLLLGLVIVLIELLGSSERRAQLLMSGLLLLHIISPSLLSKGVWSGDFSLMSPASLLGEARASSATAFLVLLYVAGLYVVRKNVTFKKVVWVYAGVWLTALSVALFLLFTPGSTIQDAYIEQASSARIIVWESGLEAFKEKPVFGWGSENFRTAYVGHFNNDLYLDENVGEIWFDRAHNVFIDSLVSVGVVGVSSFVLVIFMLLSVLYRAYKQEIIPFWETHLLGVFFLAHLLQLQTSFNVVASYAAVALFIGYILWLEKKLVGNKEFISSKVVAVIILLIVLGGATYSVGEYARQRALFSIFTETKQEKQLMFLNRALARTSDFEGLRISSASLIKGLLQQVASTQGQAQAKVVQNGLEQLNVYADAYGRYLERQPNDYRVRLNYAYLLMIQTTLGENNIEKSKELIAGSYELSPENPLTYMLDSIAHLYSGEIEVAQQRIQEGVSLNPEIVVTQEIATYIEEQSRAFPNISTIHLGNL